MTGDGSEAHVDRSSIKMTILGMMVSVIVMKPGLFPAST